MKLDHLAYLTTRAYRRSTHAELRRLIRRRGTERLTVIHEDDGQEAQGSRGRSLARIWVLASSLEQYSASLAVVAAAREQLAVRPDEYELIDRLQAELVRHLRLTMSLQADEGTEEVEAALGRRHGG